MKTIATVLFTAAFASSSAFGVLPQTTSQVAVSSSAVGMGLMDFFSDDARQKREEKKQREIEEQERLQKAIIERRKNPEKMEEYELKVMLRRRLRMAGEDEKASNVVIYDKEDTQQTLLDGTDGLQ